jgi:hypothetical protein
MEIALNTQVECTDGICGRCAYVLVNPVIGQITHVVVRAESSHTEYLVPIAAVSETIADTLRLSCSRAELERMAPFVQTGFIEEKVSDMDIPIGGGILPPGIGPYYYLPFVTRDVTVHVPVEQLQIPAGELAVQRGTRVEATDGYVGHVDEFVVNAANSRITHLVMREGHLWGQQEVIIPLTALGDTRQDTVCLKLNKHQIEALPTFPLHRHWA